MIRIAVDGPASSGKSSVGRRVARELGIGFLDTGLLYRAITRRAVDLGYLTRPLGSSELAGEPLTEIRERLTDLARITDARGEGSSFRIVVGEVPMTREGLESSDVELHVPSVASVPSVRDALRAVQRGVAARGGALLAGRDIGTVVLPDADCKIFLDASAEERAKRRALQRGFELDSTEHRRILDALIARDAEDRSRTVAPLRAAADAVVLRTDAVPIDEVVRQVVSVARAAIR